MARSRKRGPSVPPISPRRPAAWYTNLKSPESRKEHLHYLRNTIKELRQLYKGFEAKDGYDARHPETWSAQRRQQVVTRGAAAHTLKRQENFTIVRPRTDEQRIALMRRTGQTDPRQKRFVVGTDQPNTKITFAREPEIIGRFGIRTPSRLRVETRKLMKGGQRYQRDYLFNEVLDYQPITFQQMFDAYQRIQSLMPDQIAGQDVYYVLLNTRHGPISSPTLKEFLGEKILQYYEEYGTEAEPQHAGFAGSIIGFRLTGFQPDSFKEYRQRLQRRTESPMQKLNKRIRKLYHDLTPEGKLIPHPVARRKGRKHK